MPSGAAEETGLLMTIVQHKIFDSALKENEKLLWSSPAEKTFSKKAAREIDIAVCIFFISLLIISAVFIKDHDYKAIGVALSILGLTASSYCLYRINLSGFFIFALTDKRGIIIIQHRKAKIVKGKKRRAIVYSLTYEQMQEYKILKPNKDELCIVFKKEKARRKFFTIQATELNNIQAIIAAKGQI